MKYFSMSELVRSTYATEYHIANEPMAEDRRHLCEMVDNLLDPLRESWGSPIIVTSGYRSKVLNRMLGGTPTSSHCTGYAVDIKPSNGRMAEFRAFCLEWLKDKDYDQFISEDEQNGVPSWIHIGYKHTTKGQRKQNLKMVEGKYYPI